MPPGLQNLVTEPVSSGVPTPHPPAFTEGETLLACSQGIRKGSQAYSYKMVGSAHPMQNQLREFAGFGLDRDRWESANSPYSSTVGGAKKFQFSPYLDFPSMKV